MTPVILVVILIRLAAIDALLMIPQRWVYFPGAQTSTWFDPWREEVRQE